MRLSVRTVGSGDTPLAVLHGWASNSRVWDVVLPALGQAFQLHLVDLPGHGRSAAVGPGTSLAEVAAAVAEAVPPASAWLGWSLGGLVALQAATATASPVSALFLVCTTPRFVQAPDWPHAVDVTVLERFHADLRTDLLGTLGRFAALQARGAAAGRRTARALAESLRVGGLPTLTALDAGLRWLRDTDLRPVLDRVQCPTRLILGGQDALIPVEVLEDIRARHPGWQNTVLPRAGHAPFLADPGGFARAVLAEVPHG